MSNLKTPFRYDYVGSFLRPAQLKKARADYEAGTISAEQLKSVEDECIIQLVNKIKLNIVQRDEMEFLKHNILW